MTSTVSKSEAAYGWLKRRIASRELGPGYRLVLGDIAAELGMSAVPVREAIRRLEAERLVTYERNVGARVAMADPDAYGNVMQTLAVVEGAATASAAARLSPAALDAAAAVNREMRDVLARFDARRFTALNERFHAILFDACPNPHLRELVRREWTHLDAVRDTAFAFIPSRATESVREHEEILTAIRTGESAAAIEHRVREHRLGTLRAYVAARGDDTTTTDPQGTTDPRGERDDA